MTSTIEISLYPLHKEYPTSVGFEIQSNGMSTIIIGDFERMWTELGHLMIIQLHAEDSIFVLKVAPGRREYVD